MGGLLDTSNKVPIKFPETLELFGSTNWVHLTTIQNNGLYTRASSIMQVQFGRYGASKQSVLLLAIAHGEMAIPYVIALGVKNKEDVGLKLAYHKNNDNTTSIYITTNLQNGAINKIWLTKFYGLTISNDELSKIDSLPSDSVEIEP